jgi:glycolate oxidase FAD binding subunit
MIPGARAGSAADGVGGVLPAAVVEPATLDEATEVIAACARDHQSLVFVGGGTELGLGAAPEALDVVLRTTALDRIVEHAPLDQIVTVECGARLADVQRALAAHGQMLALDPPWPERATVGGVVASNAFGARRTRYGSVRDLIIGVSFVRADGARVRGGGKVVKNVAGFDLPKLLTGSLGTLGLIATATFRLHPRPETAATLVFPRVAGEEMRRLLRDARAAQLEPDAVAALRAGVSSAPAHWRLGVRFAGFARGVDDQCARLRDAGTGLGLETEIERQPEGEPDAPPGAGAPSFWEAHGQARAAAAQVRLKVALLPAEPASNDLLQRLAGPLRAARTVFYPTLGLGFVAGDVGDVGDAAAIAAAIAEVRRQLAPTGGSVVVHEAPETVRATTDVWGAPAGARAPIPIMRNLKQRLDPERRLAPGRFVAGL